MKSSESPRSWMQFGLGLPLLIIAMGLFSIARAAGEDSNSPKDNLPAKESALPAKKAEKKPQKRLNGAELYALHCNRCHPERYAPERTADQWKTILLHMRTRANLPAEQAKAILEFLQEDSGK